MKYPALFYSLLAVAIIMLILAIYYLIPGIYHPLTMHRPTNPPKKEAIFLFALALLAGIGALITGLIRSRAERG